MQKQIASPLLPRSCIKNLISQMNMKGQAFYAKRQAVSGAEPTSTLTDIIFTSRTLSETIP